MLANTESNMALAFVWLYKLTSADRCLLHIHCKNGMSVTGLKAPNCDFHQFGEKKKKLIRTTVVSSHQPAYQVGSCSHLNDDREPMTRDRFSSSSVVILNALCM